MCEDTTDIMFCPTKALTMISGSLELLMCFKDGLFGHFFGRWRGAVCTYFSSCREITCRVDSRMDLSYMRRWASPHVQKYPNEPPKWNSSLLDIYLPQTKLWKGYFLHLSVILFTGGCLPPPGQTHTPSGRHPPLGRHLPRQTPPLARHPLGRHSPTDGYCCGRYASYWNAF